MISSITSQSTTATGSVAAASRPSSEDVFKKLDSDGKGYLTQDDLVKISPKGAQAADTAKAEEAFKQMDADGDGKVSEGEFKQAAPPEGVPAGKAKGPKGGKGAPPAAAGGGGGAAKSGATSEIDPADTNEDGKVSQMERLAYDAQQARKAGSRSGSKAAEEAVKAYEVVAQASEA